MLGFLLDIVFPSYCLGCDTETSHGVAVCDLCFAAIPIHKTLFCGVCHARVPRSSSVCHKDSPYLLGAAVNYQEKTIRNLIHGLKFDHLRSVARPLGALLALYAQSLPQELFLNCIVVPVPLGIKRFRERGFNQSERIASFFSESRGIPLTLHALKRTKETKPQTELRDVHERIANVASCFIAERTEVEGKIVLLVDDVTTSGSTLHEAARALKLAGAKRVIAFAVAKA